MNIESISIAVISSVVTILLLAIFCHFKGRKNLKIDWESLGLGLKHLGNVTLGIGTLFLGLAAYNKADDIIKVVENIKDMDAVVVSIKKVNDSNNQILMFIKDLVVKLRSDFENRYADNTPENRIKLKTELKQISTNKYKKEALKKLCPSNVKNVVPDLTPVDCIINKWDKLNSEEERRKYLGEVYDNAFDSSQINGTVIKK